MPYLQVYIEREVKDRQQFLTDIGAVQQQKRVTYTLSIDIYKKESRQQATIFLVVADVKYRYIKYRLLQQ